mmetsp:Transcript_21772/g.54831  ORF Transcript_21772/g.54831 Transcript_21772/m.54831 type:complete len:201 (-) Transcript_21772:81-683(-)
MSACRLVKPMTSLTLSSVACTSCSTSKVATTLQLSHSLRFSARHVSSANISCSFDPAARSSCTLVDCAPKLSRRSSRSCTMSLVTPPIEHRWLQGTFEEPKAATADGGSPEPASSAAVPSMTSSALPGLSPGLTACPSPAANEYSLGPSGSCRSPAATGRANVGAVLTGRGRPATRAAAPAFHASKRSGRSRDAVAMSAG